MGRKQKKLWKHILLFPAACLVPYFRISVLKNKKPEECIEIINLKVTSKALIQPFLLFTGLVILHLITGCQQAVAPPDLQVVQYQAAESVETQSAQDTALELMRLESQLLDQAEASMRDGKDSEALQSVAKAISCCEGRFSERAFDLIETALARPDNELVNCTSAMKCLRQAEARSSTPGYGVDTGCWVIALCDMLATANENQKLKKTIRSQYRKIKTLKKQIEQLKAVDLEPVQPESAVEVP